MAMSETKTVGSMTDRQRRELVARLGGEPVDEALRATFAVRELAYAGAADGRRRAPVLKRPGRRRRSPGPRVAISTTWPSGSRM